MGKGELARLMGEEARTRFEETLERSQGVEFPPLLAKRIDGLKQLLDQRKEKIRVEELPKAIITAAYPPCIRALYNILLSGQHVPHVGRFALTSFLLNIGMDVEGLIKLYTSISDFDEALTRYQVEHIAGQRGSGTKYTPPNCDSLKTYNLCLKPDDLCRSVKHPLTYYRRKVAMIRGAEQSKG
jgi:DNA primase large subunit